jgi:hypothetical protein
VLHEVRFKIELDWMDEGGKKSVPCSPACGPCLLKRAYLIGTTARISVWIYVYSAPIVIREGFS